MTTQSEVLERLEVRADAFERLVIKALRHAIRAGTDKLGSVVTAAIAPEPTPAPVEPTGPSLVSLDDLAAIEAAWQRELRAVLLPQLLQYVTDGAGDALTDLAAIEQIPIEDVIRDVPVTITARHPAAELHVVQAENRLRGIGDDLWGKTRVQLVQGMAEGESVPQLAKRVREELATTTARARTIARTEVISASNAGGMAQMQALGPTTRPMAKTWLATNDSRTRPSHRLADGQTVDLDDPFTVGDAPLNFPGDPTGPADEVIQCRCTITWVVPDVPRSVAAAASLKGGTVPWHVAENHGGCPRGKPFAVVKDADDSVTGCHETREQANAQVAALYSSEGEMADLADEVVAAAGGGGAPSEDVTMGGKPNPGTKKDKRLRRNVKSKSYDLTDEEVHAEAEAVDGPFKKWKGVLAVEGKETGDGREFAAGSLEWPEPPLPLMWQERSEEKHGHSIVVGRIDAIERSGSEIVGWGVIKADAPVTEQMAHEMAGGVSVDVDSVKDTDVELVFPNDSKDESVKEEDGIAMLFGPKPEKVVFHRGRIRGATLVALPAFVEARLNLSEDEEGLVAAGAPLHPPTDWFGNPRFHGPTKWTITDDGQVFGHVALWGQCHTTFADQCITPPRERDYPYFLKGELKTAEGSLVGIGTITFGTGHAALRLGARPAAAHYDNTGTAAVDVTVGEDKWGIWVAGALRPSVTEFQLRELRAATLSGDWRRIGGRLRLVAVLAVNVPGFPIPKMRASYAADELSTLVAAGIPTDARIEKYDRPLVEEGANGTIKVRLVR